MKNRKGEPVSAKIVCGSELECGRETLMRSDQIENQKNDGKNSDISLTSQFSDDLCSIKRLN
jgi:hypothetical protein